MKLSLIHNITTRNAYQPVATGAEGDKKMAFRYYGPMGKGVNSEGMELFDDLKEGIFQTRPNRFVVECTVEGRNVRAYLPNPGRLTELFLPDSRLLLVKHDPASGRKLAYTVVAVEKDGVPVMLHTHSTNDVARVLIEHDRISGLEGARIVKPEHTIGHSRFDFLLSREGRELVLEVKSCTLFSGRIAMFPDAITDRGRRHLMELAELSRTGMQTAVLFIVHSPSVDYFMPEHHTDLAFSRTLFDVRHDVMVKAVGVTWAQDLRLGSAVRELSIPWDLVDRESHDRGSYIVVLRLSRDRVMEIGDLGKMRFRKGYYLYTGSAKADLTQRIERHRRITTKVQGHIDYLRRCAEWHASFPIRTSDELECDLASALGSIAEWSVPGFSAIDCACATHLFGMAGDPLHNAAFIDILMDFRIRRLEKKIEA